MKTLIFSILILIAAQAAAQTTEPTVEQRSNANYIFATVVANETGGYITREFKNRDGEYRYVINPGSGFTFDLLRLIMRRIDSTYENVKIDGAFTQNPDNPNQYMAFYYLNDIIVAVVYTADTNLILIM